MNFGEKVKLLRQQKNMTQRELANALGVTIKTVSNYELLGKHPRNREIYNNIALIFGVDVNYLLTENDEFIFKAQDQYGDRGALQAETLIQNATALFSGGSVSEEDKDAVMRAIQDAYWTSKEINSKAIK